MVHKDKPVSGLHPNDSLASTSRWTASVRALEHLREDRLFADPWAAALAGEPGQAWIGQHIPEKVIPIVLRTRFFDDYLMRAVTQAPAAQAVLMAAGLDTRAFRLSWPAATQVFELDRPAVLEEKERILAAAGAQPACKRRVIGVDLAQRAWQEALLRAGYRPEAPAVWLLEGFLFYLTRVQIERLLDEVTDLAAPGSRLGFDIINWVMLTHPLTRQWIEMQAAAGAPWIGTMDDPAAFLAQRGWKATVTQAGEPDANFGRWPFPVLPVDRPDIPHNWFVTAEKEG